MKSINPESHYSESSLNFKVSSSSPRVSTTDQPPPLMKSSRKQSDPPPSVLSMVSTVDEYEARREPHRRRLKEQEKRSGKPNATDNRSDQLRRILSIGTIANTGAKSSSFLIPGNNTKHNNNTNNSVALNNASDYVSVQELIPPKEQSRIGKSSRVAEEQQPPLSQTSNDIFEAYQQSFIGSEQGDYPSPVATTTSSTRQSNRQQQLRRPRPINRRSVSAPVVTKSQQPPPPSEGRGLFRRFFPKKDAHLKIEI